MLGAGVIVILSVVSWLTCANELAPKLSLRIDTTFEEDERNHTVERNRMAQEKINLTVPGTKWCGPGNTANGYDDLGSDREVDMCCRTHDHCDNMAAGEERHGLKNDNTFTRLHCQCDKEFKQCLQRLNSRSANFIGNVYFSVRDCCYKEQHPIVSCDEFHTKIFLRRCIRYVIDSTQALKWQWFDLPFYDDEHDFEFIIDEHQSNDDEEEGDKRVYAQK